MRLKIFEFDIANSQLFNSETQSSVHLTRTECQVLELLATHPNQVMSKGQLACAGSQTAVMSESAVAKAVFTLRKHFGEAHAELIETFPRKGYRLNIAAPNASWSQHSKARKKYLLLTVTALFISCIAVVTAMHEYILFKHIDAPIKTSRNIVLDNGQKLILTWLESPRIRLRQEVSVEAKVVFALNRCPHLTWDRVYLAFSNDMQVLNVSMLGKTAKGGTLMRNIKTIDFSLSPEFISEDWLKEVSLCD
ncbi:helix-turn-helix domain-containing protein [Shewanella sp. KX20019]|uniref:winged helix-turn-helix domain-containing protein n=1 Tax=Shewanella sp. KX20019 TaxID=2803864 RepID=UPI00192749A1|nr:helix-turn-helix domain-containing protein [Shewanella sp. KX20019]QQX79401.1 helix-turn-helix domain-containing protein [Shewanella sp. KX20019]